ncbi:FKBP-type peptidyl-prolyl cis-trans isomerase [soil metagenome]
MRCPSALAFICVALALVGCSKKSAPAIAALEKKDIVVGKGREAMKGDLISVHYRGYLDDGTEFDKNLEPDAPFQLELGAGSVIRGWDLGLLGMKEGGKRHLHIPPGMAYGPVDRPKIPGNSNLQFDVELVAVNDKVDPSTVLAKILTPGKGPKITDSSTVTITYEAKDAEGKPVDSSASHGGSVTFKLGTNATTSNGFETGLAGMQVGETRRITLPPGMWIMTGPGDPRAGGNQVVTVKLLKFK